MDNLKIPGIYSIEHLLEKGIFFERNAKDLGYKSLDNHPWKYWIVDEYINYNWWICCCCHKILLMPSCNEDIESEDIVCNCALEYGNKFEWIYDEYLDYFYCKQCQYFLNKINKRKDCIIC